MNLIELNRSDYNRMVYYHTVLENNMVRLSFSRLPKNLSVEESTHFFNKAINLYLEDATFCYLESQYLRKIPKIGRAIQKEELYSITLEDIYE